MLKQLAIVGPKGDPGGSCKVAALVAELADALETAHPGVMTTKRDAAWIAEM